LAVTYGHLSHLHKVRATRRRGAGVPVLCTADLPPPRSTLSAETWRLASLIAQEFGDGDGKFLMPSCTILGHL